jgi:hypothetical protein
MADLYIRSKGDLPHTADDGHTEARCGVWLGRAMKITAAQALVYLGDARCPRCFPGWTTGGHGVRH